MKRRKDRNNIRHFVSFVCSMKVIWNLLWDGMCLFCLQLATQLLVFKERSCLSLCVYSKQHMSKMFPLSMLSSLLNNKSNKETDKTNSIYLDTIRFADNCLCVHWGSRAFGIRKTSKQHKQPTNVSRIINGMAHLLRCSFHFVPKAESYFHKN